ncbi:MAG: hypothetical protein HW406_1378, partial [Candidatus Brocadiaceae bacterium]|nr:hypothetical protein [Candidatus Brocadiaceae bacterium]
MRKQYLAQKFGFFLCILFIFSGVAFSEEKGAIVLPKYFIKMEKEAKKGGRVEKKVSGLLQIQIQIKNSYMEQPTTERLNAMQKMGMKTEEADKQLVYIHLKRKLNTSQIASLKKIGVTIYEDTWVPPLENHPTG